MSEWEEFCDSMGYANDASATDRLINHINRNNEKDKEYELRANGYKTIQEWNAVGRISKKGEKGRHLPYGKITLFSPSQTIESRTNPNSQSQQRKIYFQTFEEAIAWAKINPGKSITCSPTGKGYIEK